MTITTVPAALSPRQLAEEVRKLAATPRQWMARVRLSADGRLARLDTEEAAQW